jgi:hypothetical protein
MIYTHFSCGEILNDFGLNSVQSMAALQVSLAHRHWSELYTPTAVVGDWVIVIVAGGKKSKFSHDDIKKH